MGEEKALKTAYDVPWFFPTINVLKQLLELMAFQFFHAPEGGHDLLFQPLFRSFFFFFRPPPPGLHKKSEPNDRVIHLLPILNFLSGAVGK